MGGRVYTIHPTTYTGRYWDDGQRYADRGRETSRELLFFFDPLSRPPISIPAQNIPTAEVIDIDIVAVSKIV